LRTFTDKKVPEKRIIKGGKEEYSRITLYYKKKQSKNNMFPNFICGT
jgi:hypothetical protein